MLPMNEGKKVYKVLFDTIINEDNIKMGDYVVETDNYYIEIYTYVVKDFENVYAEIFEKMIDSLSEK